MRGLTRPVVVAGALAMALAGCWVQPGSDARRSSFSSLEQGITPANVSQLHEAWTKQLTGRVNAPVVTLDGIYASDGFYPQAGAITLVSGVDGSTRWSKPLFGASSGFSSGPPTLAGGSLFVPTPAISGVLTGSISAFDPATGAPSAGVGRASYEVIGRGTKLVGTFAQGNSSRIGASHVFVAETNGTGGWTSLLDVITGSVPAVTSPAIGTDRFVIGRNATVQAFSLATPTTCNVFGSFTVCDPIWSTSTTTPVAGHPVLSADDATVFAAAGTTLKTLNAATGTPGWTGTLGATASNAPAIGNGYVYVPTTTGELDVFAEAGCGQTTCAPLWTATTGSAISQPPAVVPGGLVYTASADGTLRAYNSAGCATSPCPSLWSATTGSTITGGPVPGLGQLYIGTADGRLIAYRL